MNDDTINLFVGFDQVEAAAYHTFIQSVIEHTECPVNVTPLKNSMLPFFSRPREQLQSNEFTYSRFLVPYLCRFQGWGLFMEPDMMLRSSLEDLWALRDDQYDVMCVQHDYTPKTTRKFLGATQYTYPRKNWSSVMLFNCHECQNLTPEYVEAAEPADLHRMRWTTDERIGELPEEWNWLVGEYPHNPNAQNVHWTIGGPWFDEYVDTDYANEWFEMYGRMTHAEQLANLLRRQAAMS